MSRRIKFCHISDTHLGYRQYKNDIRYEDYFNAFIKALKVCIKHDPDFIVLTGDLFQRYDPSYGTLVKFFNICDNLFAKNPGLRIFIIPGTHDFPRRDSQLKNGYCFNIFEHTKYKDNIIVLEDDIKVLNASPSNKERFLIAGLRYYHSEPLYRLKMLLHDSKHSSLYDETDGIPKILLMHQYTSGMSKVKKQSVQFDENLLEEYGFNYIGVGHTHYKWEKRQLNLYCPGSTEHVSISDWEQPERYVYVVDILLNEESGVWKTTAIPKEFTVRPKFQEIIDLGETTYENAVKKLDVGIVGKVPNDSVVKITIRGVLPPGEIRLLDLREMEDVIKTEKGAIHVEITDNLFPDLEGFTPSSEETGDILDELITDHFNINGKVGDTIKRLIQEIQRAPKKIDDEFIKNLLSTPIDNIPEGWIGSEEGGE
ncbi:MAG: exonuclease SbcCD subunit D [Candidatus Hodarchaeota archaeon]